MNDKLDFIDDEIPTYRKKSKKKGQSRADHKHTYETVLLIRHYRFNLGEPRASENKQPTKVCTICGRIGDVDTDSSLYETNSDQSIKSWAVWVKDLSEKALNLPKWYVKDYFDKFAFKMED